MCRIHYSYGEEHGASQLYVFDGLIADCKSSTLGEDPRLHRRVMLKILGYGSSRRRAASLEVRAWGVRVFRSGPQ